MWGEESSYESESFGVNEVDEEGEIISSPHSPPPPPRESPCLVIFLVNRKVFPLVHARRNAPGRMQVWYPARRWGLVSRWYARSCREHMLTLTTCR
jgi:hypothetical protein